MSLARCPNCGSPVAMGPHTVGQSVTCAKCGRLFTVSSSAQLPPPRASTPPPRQADASGIPKVKEPTESRLGSGGTDSVSNGYGQFPILLIAGACVVIIAVVAAAVATVNIGRQRQSFTDAVSPEAQAIDGETVARTLPAAGASTEVAPLSSAGDLQLESVVTGLPEVTAPGKELTSSNNGVPNHPMEALGEDLEQLIERVEPSVVIVVVRTNDGRGFGSGVVVDANGTIATNAHVVSDALDASVVFDDGHRFSVTGLIFLDEARDIALLKADMGHYAPPPVPLAHEHPKKGAKVVTFGSPEGLTFSVSDGIVAGTREGATLDQIAGGVGAKPGMAGTWIQTTAPISPGNSGGPLVNLQGQLVGLNTKTLVADGSAQNLNFAISCVDLHAALLASQRQTPISLGDHARQSRRSPVAPTAVLAEDSLAVLAFIDDELSATMQNDLAARLRSLDMNLASSPADTAWVIVGMFDQEIRSGLDACEVDIVLFQRHIANDGRIEPRAVWGTSIVCSGPSIMKNYNSQVTNVLKEFVKSHRQFRK